MTSLAFVDRVPGSGKGDLLVTGSWDKVALIAFAALTQTI